MSVRSRLDETFSHSLYLWLWEVRDMMLVFSYFLLPLGWLIVDKVFAVYACGIGLFFVTGITLMMLPMELTGRGLDMNG